MFTKAKKGLGKRILALFLVFLMTISLLPTEQFNVLADEVTENQYTLTLTAEEETSSDWKNSIEVKAYTGTLTENLVSVKDQRDYLRENGSEVEFTIEAEENVTSIKFTFDTTAFAQDTLFEYSIDGYRDGYLFYDSEIPGNEVIMSPVNEVKFSGTVKLDGDDTSLESEVENELSIGIYSKSQPTIQYDTLSYTYDADGNAVINAEEVYELSKTSDYYLKIYHTNNKFAPIEIEIDETAFDGQETYAFDEQTVTLNQEAEISFENINVDLYKGNTVSNPLTVKVKDSETVLDNYTVSYFSSDHNVATVDSNGIVTATDTANANDTVTITVRVSNNQYYIADKYYTVTVKLNSQDSLFSFVDANGDPVSSVDVELGKEIPKVTAKHENENAVIAYSIKDANGQDVASEVASIAADGTVTVNKVGTYVVYATSSLTNYEDASISYTLEVTKTSPDLTLETPSVYEVINGQWLLDDFDIPYTVTTLADVSSIEVSLSYDASYTGDTDLVVLDDANNIKINGLKAPGEDVVVTITVTVPESENYRSESVSFTVTIKDWAPAGGFTGMYTVSEPNGTNGWYTEVSEDNALVITANAGYRLFSSEWNGTDASVGVDTLSVEELSDGESVGIEFYLMEEATGAVSLCTVNDIKVDQTAPSAGIKQGEMTLLEKVLYFFGDIDAPFTIISDDDMSGVSKVYYAIASIDILEEDSVDYNSLTWVDCTDDATVKFNNDGKYVLFAKVVDNAGNISYANTNGLIVDGTDPVVEVVTPDSVSGFYKDDIELKVEVQEEPTISSGIASITYQIYVGDEAQTNSPVSLYSFELTDTTTKDDLVYKLNCEGDDSENCNNITVPAVDSDAVVKVVITVTDNAGNVQEKTEELKFATVQPTMTTEMDEEIHHVDIDGVDYYKEKAIAKATILTRDDLYNANNVVVKITKDGVVTTGVLGTDYVITKVEDGKYEVAITFDETGKYSYEVTYTDLVEESVTVATAEEFCVDATVPVIKLSYDNNSGNAVMIEESVMTFFKANRTVTIQIIDEDFVEANATVIVTRTNIDKSAADFEYTVEWTSEGDTHTAQIPMSNEGIYTLAVEYADKVGNEAEKNTTDVKAPYHFVIDKTASDVQVSFGDEYVKEVNGKGYYNADRTATIVVTEASQTFDKDKFVEGIVLNAQPSTAKPSVEHVSSVGEVHTFKISFAQDANYNLAIAYADCAGNISTIEYGESTTPNDFVVDTTAPYASIKINNYDAWTEFLNMISFGLYAPALDVTVTPIDATSPCETYYFVSKEVYETKDALVEDATWTSYANAFGIPNEGKHIVYVKVVDYAGNVGYVSSNGIIVDNQKPAITITTEQPASGIYTKDVTINVKVEEPESAEGTYSGLKSVSYVVNNMGTDTQTGTLYTHNNAVNKAYEGSFTVSAAKNNSNDVKVTVYVEDNAGNKFERFITLKIDTTAPEISVSYDNNDGDTTFSDGVYYDGNRTATISIAERNFDASKVNVSITNSDGAVPTVSEWTKTSNGSGNGDDTVYTAKVVFSADGDYTFDVSCTDNAGNDSGSVNYGESQAPTKFTIDKTLPTVNVAYDNNDATNENYFKADRTATITITEHNFDASRVDVNITATDGGAAIGTPSISGWSTSGDTHTATINYSSDALYTFDISFEDKAGNEMADFAEQTFYVDKTNPTLSISGIADQSANNEETIGFTITATDTNFDVFTPVITAVIKTENGFTSQEIEAGTISEISNGRVYTVNNLTSDGIYRINCTLVDKAGNAFSEVVLERADGTTYTEAATAEDTLISFSVNRSGSAFEVNEETSKVIENYYVQAVADDVVIVEVNANELLSYAVTLNGVTLVEGTDYTVSSSGGDGEWMRYTYTIKKELFAAEGEYIIVISSTDIAENDAYSDVKNTSISFVVDRTAPVVTVAGLESNTSYEDVPHAITVMPTDDGGQVASLAVYLLDESGNIKEELYSLSGDELITALDENEGMVTLQIDEGLNQNIQIVCSDSAVDDSGKGNTANIVYENVNVTANGLAVFLTGGSWIYILIGIAAVVVVIIVVVVAKKKKNK